MDKNLFAFLNVVETGNLSQAAQNIGLAQPSLTKRLKALESEYGAQLFERLPHGMAPTPFGKTLYDHAKRIEQLHLQANEALEAQKIGHLELVRIGAGPIVRSYFMRALIEELMQEFPGTRFDFREDVHVRNLPFLKNGDLDAVFGAVSDGQTLDEIETYPMRNLSLGILAHEDHPLFKKANITAHDLLDQPWVHHADDGVAGHMVQGYYARNGLSVPASSVRTTSLEFGVELVATGRYLMPAATELAKTFEHFGIRALPLEQPLDHFPIGAYIRTSSLQYPVIKRLIEIALSLSGSANLETEAPSQVC